MNRVFVGVGGLALVWWVAHLVLGKGFLGFVKKQMVGDAKDQLDEKVQGKFEG